MLIRFNAGLNAVNDTSLMRKTKRNAVYLQIAAFETWYTLIEQYIDLKTPIFCCRRLISELEGSKT
jgi:hypothetical protein